MQPVHVSRTLPVVLSREEVARLIAAAPNLKHQTALSLAYGTGLRARKVVSLKIGDIDSQRMTLRVEQGRGSKDRYAMLLPVRVLSRLFRRLFLEALEHEHRAGTLKFFSELTALADPKAFARWLAPLRRCERVVYAKKPFARPQAVLAHLSRSAHELVRGGNSDYANAAGQCCACRCHHLRPRHRWHSRMGAGAPSRA